MTLTVTVTPFPANVPPRNQISITDTTPGNATAAFILTRNDPDGRARPVIGSPSPRLTTGAAVVFDYHAPFNTPVTYTVVTTLTASTALVTLTMAKNWLIHRSNQVLSVAVDKIINIADRVVPSTAVAHFAFGARYPVVRNEGTRRARTGNLTLQVNSAAQMTALVTLLQDSGVILMNLTLGQNVGWMDETWAWIQPGDLTFNNPAAGWAFFPSRHVSFPYQVVDIPATVGVALWNYATLLADVTHLPTYASLMTTYANYANVVIDFRI